MVKVMFEQIGLFGEANDGQSIQDKRRQYLEYVVRLMGTKIQ
jgi:hypothetical protein